MEYLIRIWHSYPVLLDFGLYFLVFGAAARVGFAKSFPNHEGRILSVAVGLFLAASLAVAQRDLGFSIENLGPVAAFILCGIVFLAAYKFIHHADISKPVAVLLSALVALALARAALPHTTAEFTRENPLMIFLVLAGLVYWGWHSSQTFAGKIDKRRPGRVLERNHAVPGEQVLEKETRYVNKRLKKGTRRNRKEEKGAGLDLEQALDISGKQEPNKRNFIKVRQRIDAALEKANHILVNCNRLLQLDGALCRYDWHWLKRTHAVNVGMLTPRQQTLVKDCIREERRKLNVEEALEKLEREVDAHVRAMAAYAATAKASAKEGSSAGVSGWLSQAVSEAEKAQKLESRILQWEKRLLRLVKKQRRELVGET